MYHLKFIEVLFMGQFHMKIQVVQAKESGEILAPHL